MDKIITSKKGLILKNRVFIPDYNDFDIMIDELGLDDVNSHRKNYIKAELWAKGYHIKIEEREKWKLKIHMDVLPKWFKPDQDKERLYNAVKDWVYKRNKISYMKKITYRACLNAVKENGWELRHIPVELITPNMCKNAIKYDSEIIKYIPDSLKTYDMCLFAVQGCGHTLSQVPNRHKSYEMCFEAIIELAGSDYDPYIISCIPDKVLTKEFKEEVYSKTGICLD